MATLPAIANVASAISSGNFASNLATTTGGARVDDSSSAMDESAIDVSAERLLSPPSPLAEALQYQKRTKILECDLFTQ